MLLTLLLSWALTAQANENFCVQTFNTYGPFYAANTEARTDLLVQDLTTNGLCDFLFLQEMWNQNHYLHFQGLMSIDFEQTHLVRADYIRNDGMKSGLVTATKNSFLDPLSFLYVVNKAGLADDLREEFGVSKAMLVFTSQLFGQNLRVMNTHLHQSSTPVRLAQLTQLHQALQNSNGYTQPWIFSGDLNFIPGSLEWRFLTVVMGFRDSFDEVAQDKEACTYCAENPSGWDSDSRRIDYVLYRSTAEVKFKPVAAQVVFKGEAEFPLSDHYGIKTDFAFGEETAAPVFSEQERRQVLTEVIATMEMENRNDLAYFIEYLKKQLTK